MLATYLQQRWQVEVAFQEIRTHLGVETRHQWSAAAIARTTPVLIGLSVDSSWRGIACTECVSAGPPGMPRPSPRSPTSWPASATSLTARTDFVQSPANAISKA